MRLIERRSRPAGGGGAWFKRLYILFQPVKHERPSSELGIPHVDSGRDGTEVGAQGAEHEAADSDGEKVGHRDEEEMASKPPAALHREIAE